MVDWALLKKTISSIYLPQHYLIHRDVTKAAIGSFTLVVSVRVCVCVCVREREREREILVGVIPIQCRLS